MKRLIVVVLLMCMCISLCACGISEEVKNVEEVIQATTEATKEQTQPETEPTVIVAGNKYLCTLVEITDEDYDVFDVADSVHRKLFNSSIVISDNHTKIVYTNELGVYVADIIAEYDGEMWYECEVIWQETPTPYGEHKVTATTLIFDEARGLVRMNFSLDGEIGDKWSGIYFIFNEFEIE